MNNRRLRHALFHRWLWFHAIRFFNPHAMLFDLGDTAKAEISLTSARTAGQCMDNSRWAYLKFIG
jgi:hypothetical protein